jgi:hypothetical protein
MDSYRIRDGYAFEEKFWKLVFMPTNNDVKYVNVLNGCQMCTLL